jgi:phosphate transport system substrate-binding protein
MIAPEDPEQRLGLQHMLRNELANDRFGMAWTIMSQAKQISGIKPLALAARGSQKFVTPSRETFKNREYPLARNIYIYFNRPPGEALEPRIAAFLRFVLSVEGQAMVEQGGYLPLPDAMRRAEIAKLDANG